ncbi:MAG TPA: FUSC family protein [Luteimonas sp.]|nr:FUSC family protein [Luteimonas sp.]
MEQTTRWARLRRLLREEWRSLATFQASGRRWPMPLAAALASGAPLLVAAMAGDMQAGLAGSLGGLVFLYLPGTSMHHRMVTLMACGFAMAACYAIGLGVQALGAAALRAPLIALVAMLVTMTVRYYRLPPPGPLFFVMAIAIGAYTPLPADALARQVGLLFLGVLVAGLVAFGYSLAVLARWPATPDPVRQPAGFGFVVVEAVVIGAAVGASLLLAELLRLPRPYWVPVSCLAVVQGASLRAVWDRQFQRVAGSAMGMLVAGALLSLPFDAWRIAIAVMALTFVVESLVVRHYGLAVVFITPLTILLADAAALGSGAPVGALLRARFLDTALGCLVGLAGGVCLHSPGLRAALERGLRAMLPRRFRSAR